MPVVVPNGVPPSAAGTGAAARPTSAGNGSGESPWTISANGPPGNRSWTRRAAPGRSSSSGPPTVGGPARHAFGTRKLSTSGSARPPVGGGEPDLLDQQAGRGAVDVGSRVVHGQGGQPAVGSGAAGGQVGGIGMPAGSQLAQGHPLEGAVLVQPGGEAQRRGTVHLGEVDGHLEPARGQAQRVRQGRQQGVLHGPRRAGVRRPPAEHPIGPGRVDRDHLRLLVARRDLHGGHRVPAVGVRGPDGVQQGPRVGGPHLQHHLRAGLGLGALDPVAFRDRPALHPDQQQAGGDREHGGDPGGARAARDPGPADGAGGPAPGQRHRRTTARDPDEQPGGEQPAGHRDHARAEQGHRARPATAVGDQLHDAGQREHQHDTLDQAGPLARAPRRHPAQQLGDRPAEHLAGGQRGGHQAARDRGENGEQHRPGEDHLGARGEHPAGRPADGEVADHGAQRRSDQQQQEHLGQPEPPGLRPGHPAQLRQPDLGGPLLGRRADHQVERPPAQQDQLGHGERRGDPHQLAAVVGPGQRRRQLGVGRDQVARGRVRQPTDLPAQRRGVRQPHLDRPDRDVDGVGRDLAERCRARPDEDRVRGRRHRLQRAGGRLRVVGREVRPAGPVGRLHRHRVEGADDLDRQHRGDAAALDRRGLLQLDLDGLADRGAEQGQAAPGDQALAGGGRAAARGERQVRAGPGPLDDLPDDQGALEGSRGG